MGEVLSLCSVWWRRSELGHSQANPGTPRIQSQKHWIRGDPNNRQG